MEVLDTTHDLSGVHESPQLGRVVVRKGGWNMPYTVKIRKEGGRKITWSFLSVLPLWGCKSVSGGGNLRVD